MSAPTAYAAALRLVLDLAEAPLKRLTALNALIDARDLDPQLREIVTALAALYGTLIELQAGRSTDAATTVLRRNLAQHAADRAPQHVVLATRLTIASLERDAGEIESTLGTLSVAETAAVGLQLAIGHVMTHQSRFGPSSVRRLRDDLARAIAAAQGGTPPSTH
ncbi:hypothetical protein [Plantibacter sp. CFBP 8804]|uniref:hypothetical protein n=1 Tax=Plantibacter sp. CFBP 8804 TaxID=2775270 RepID=UPI0017826779|nr:hypothetical protein [Plantibacter sp. CFBP 8804]MBD8517076.1 hypothetical protein [Plantibacter sp. CFBP 8804]